MLKTGDKAPNFTLTDKNGREVSLSDYLGKKVVLYFYPKDNTSGCTAEACNLRDNYEALVAKGYNVIGVSQDSVESHKNFKEQHALPFTLLADTATNMIKAFGVWGEQSINGKKYTGTLRTTFIFNEEGILTKIIEKVDTENHAAQILK